MSGLLLTFNLDSPTGSKYFHRYGVIAPLLNNANVKEMNECQLHHRKIVFLFKILSHTVHAIAS